MIETSLVFRGSHNWHTSSPNSAPDILYWSSYNTIGQQVPEMQAWQNHEANSEFMDDLVYSADEEAGAWISRVARSESPSVIVCTPNRSPGLLVLGLPPSFTCIQSSVFVFPPGGFLKATENMIHFFSVRSFSIKAPNRESAPQGTHCSWSQPSYWPSFPQRTHTLPVFTVYNPSSRPLITTEC